MTTANSESSDHCRAWTLSHSARGPSEQRASEQRASEQAVRPIGATMCAAYWDIRCRTISKSALTLIPVALSVCCAD